MPISTAAQAQPIGKRSPQKLFQSEKMMASAVSAKSIQVEVVVQAGQEDYRRWASLVEAIPGPTEVRAARKDKHYKSPVREAMKAAFVTLFRDRLSEEIEKVVDAYRLMLRESLVKGDDEKLQAALNRARLQERVLASTSMVDQAQACELLGLSATNPSATMKRREDKRELLRFNVDGRAAYPLFQFDVEGRRLFPVVATLIALKPEAWSDFRLLHWLTRPHLDFGGSPSEFLGSQEQEVEDAFKREIEPPVHG